MGAYLKSWPLVCCITLSNQFSLAIGGYSENQTSKTINWSWIHFDPPIFPTYPRNVHQTVSFRVLGIPGCMPPQVCWNSWSSDRGQRSCTSWSRKVAGILHHLWDPMMANVHPKTPCQLNGLAFRAVSRWIGWRVRSQESRRIQLSVVLTCAEFYL